MSGSAYVLEVPLGAGSGTVTAPAPEPEAEPVAGPGGPEAGQQSGGGRRRARRASTDAFLESPVGGSGAGAGADGDTAAAEPTGRRRARREPVVPDAAQIAESARSEGSGRRRGRPSPAETGAQQPVPGRLRPPSLLSRVSGRRWRCPRCRPKVPW